MKNGAVVCCTVILLVLIGLHAPAGQRQEHPAITITSDYEFTVENGVCSGQGTADDPYVIEELEIDAGLDDYGIRIHGTTRCFVIRNVEITGAAKSAVYLSYVQNGTIEDCTFEANWVGVTLGFASFNRIARCTFHNNTDGVHFYFSGDNQILNNTFDRNDTAVWLDASDDNELIGNLVTNSHMGVYLNLGSEANYIVGNAFVGNVHNARTDEPNLWDDGSAGNFWSDYSAIDADENGIWDLHYCITSEGDQDNYPLVTHPLVPAPPAPTCDG
jgi:parallel beta-helix repeat protein